MGDLFVTCSASGDGQFVLARYSVQDVVNQPVGVNWNIPPNYHGPVGPLDPNGIWTRRNMGQVYGTAVDPRGNVYVSASSVYGPYYNGVTNGNNSPGQVYRIDPIGNIVPLGQPLPNALGPATDGTQNPVQTFPALGNICYDQWHDQLLVSNFEDGMIYRMDPNTGAILGSIDPVDPNNTDAVAGFAPMGDRVWAVACHGTHPGNVTLYYSVWSTDFRPANSPIATVGPNTVHSMSLGPTGDFVPITNQLIYTQPQLFGTDPNNPSSPVADIAVSPDGQSLLLAERTMVGELKPSLATAPTWSHRSRLLQLDANGIGGWNALPVTHYEPGENGVAPYSRRNSAGGADWGLWDLNPNDGDPGDCEEIVWCMSSALQFHNDQSTPRLYGFQSFPVTGGTNANSVLVDLDGQTSSTFKGLLGDVELYRNCCDLVDVEAEPAKGGNCCFNLNITNAYAEHYYSAIEFNVLGTGVAQWTLLDQDFAIASSSTTQLTLTAAGGGDIPTGQFGEVLNVCIDQDQDPELEVVWLDFNGDTICVDTLRMTCEPATCLQKTFEELVCKEGQYVYSFSIENVSNFTMQSIDFHTTSAGNITVTPDPLVIPALPPGQTGGPYSIVLSGPDAIPGNEWCFFLSGHSEPDPATSPWCCTDSTICCLTFPSCEDCDSLDAYLDGNDLTCTYDLHLVNDWDASTFTTVETELLNGGTFTSVSSNFGYDESHTASQITWSVTGGAPFPVGDLNVGSFSASYTPDPHIMAIRWYAGDSLYCTDTLVFSCDNNCIGVLEDSIYCSSDGAIMYKFTMYNNANFTVQSLGFFNIAPLSATVNPNPIGPVSIPPGGTYTGTVEISGVAAGDDYCFLMVAHNHFGGNDHTQCCPSDTICVTIPPCSPCGPPEITMRGDGQICDGESEILCVDPCVFKDCKTGIWVIWTLPNNTQASGSCIPATMPGNYCVEVFCNGLSLGTDCQMITQLPPGYLNIEGTPRTTPCVGDQVTLYADYCCDNPSFLWSNGATTQSITVTVTAGFNFYSVSTSCKGGSSGFDAVSWFGQFCEKKKTRLESPELSLEAIPNPFSENTTIRFTLPEAGRAAMKIYSAAGQLMGTLFDGPVEAGRNYSQEISGDGLSNGIYYIRLQTDGGTILTRKLVLTR